MFFIIGHVGEKQFTALQLQVSSWIVRAAISSDGLELSTSR